MTWRIGMHVRLVKPDNPNHPCKGEVGEIIRFDSCPADQGWPKRGKPARTLLWTRFQKARWEDCRGKRMWDVTFGVFDYEVEEV
jgi:hypothetical protein